MLFYRLKPNKDNWFINRRDFKEIIKKMQERTSVMKRRLAVKMSSAQEHMSHDTPAVTV